MHESPPAKGISRPVYLHFLDRELLTCFGLYDSLPTGVIADDFRSILRSASESTYISASLVFENRFARHLLRHYTLLFQTGHVRLAMQENSLADFVLSKREQYAHAKETYSFYFDDTWRRLLDLGPVLMHKGSDTGAWLERRLLARLETEDAGDSARRLGLRHFEPRLIAEVSPYLIDALQDRRGLAVTRLLFGKPYEAVGTPEAIQRSIDILITEEYVRAYLAEFDGTLFTGLSCGLHYFDHICETWPYHHLVFWNELSRRMGLTATFRKLRVKDILVVREALEFQALIDQGRRFFAAAATAHETTGDSRTKADVYVEQMIRGIPVGASQPDADVDSFLRQTEKAAAILASAAPPARALRTRPRRLGDAFRMKRTVFVVHGRNNALRLELFTLLRASGLEPLEWAQAIALTGKGSPYVGEVLDLALSKAQAIVVILSGDDLAKLRDDLRGPGEAIEDPQPQPRPNVILEAGMALGRNPDRTVLVQCGKLRDISDILGRHVVRLNNSAAARKHLLTRLETAGCPVDMTGDDWMTAGDFSQCTGF